ncbi:hypothetical protein O181_030043 [Austropuccinia psidii MF-1]|uniref:Uncharacterized protein n=1 Tax=Austropuccinia psidii MF-1 TaxID=1389203 RepID=A0A9Q3H3B4_9BASI|nr:hypothetical protein [Austropuccinia psidii MF-1]
MPKECDCNTHSQCQLLTPTFPASNLTPPSYPALFSFTSKQRLIKLPSGSDLPMIQTPLLPHQKTRLAFLWDGEIPNGQSACNTWATSPPGSTFDARHIITNKVISSFKSLFTNTPLGVANYKPPLLHTNHYHMPTLLNYQLAI